MDFYQVTLHTFFSSMMNLVCVEGGWLLETLKNVYTTKSAPAPLKKHSPILIALI